MPRTFSWPHLETIADPDVLGAELERGRLEYNSVCLDAAVGYVTPNDEHAGRGDAIRLAAETDSVKPTKLTRPPGERPTARGPHDAV